MKIERFDPRAGEPIPPPLGFEEAAAMRKRARKKVSLRVKTANANIKSAFHDLGITEAFADTEVTYGVALYLRDKMSSATFRRKMKAAGAEWIGPADEQDVPVADEPIRPVEVEDRPHAESETDADHVQTEPSQPPFEIGADERISAIETTDIPATASETAKPVAVPTSSETVEPLDEQIGGVVDDRESERVAATKAAIDAPETAMHVSEGGTATPRASAKAGTDPGSREGTDSADAGQEIAPSAQPLPTPRLNGRPTRPGPVTYPSKAGPPQERQAVPAKSMS
jgi:hypothetical protein